MKNKKGFSLVELLAVLTLLGILSLIAIPAITKSINNAREKADLADEEIIKRAAKGYYAELLLSGNPIDIINVSDLIEKGYISNNESEEILQSKYGEMCVFVSFNEKYKQYEYELNDCEGHVPDYCFTLVDYSGGVKITKYDFSNEECPLELTIPTKIENKKVLAIAENAFKPTASSRKLTSVNFSKIPAIKEIGKDAFRDNNISKITFGTGFSLTSIGRGVFRNNLLQNVAIPNSVKVIEEMAFAQNDLNAVSFPKGLTEIKAGAFYDNSFEFVDLGNLTSLTILGEVLTGNNLTYVDKANVNKLKENADETNTYGVFYDNPLLKSIIFPEGLEHIGSYFIGKQGDDSPCNLENLVFPNSLKTIGNQSFAYCKKLKGNVVIPSNVTHIGGCAFDSPGDGAYFDFSKATSLVEIGEASFGSTRSSDGMLDLTSATNLRKIDSNAFFWSNYTGLNLKNMTNLTSIEQGAFQHSKIATTNITGLTNLTSIGNDAFRYTPITSLDLTGANNLSTIGSYAFAETGLKTLTLSGLSNLATINTGAFGNNSYTNVTLSNLPKLTSLNSLFPNSTITNLTVSNLTNLTSIGANAFKNIGLSTASFTGMTKLATIGASAFEGNANITSFPFSTVSSLTSIGDKAFYGTKITTLNLTSLTNLTSIGTSAFENNNLSTVTLTGSSKLNTLGKNSLKKASGSNTNMTKIVNNTGNKFSWYNVTGIGDACSCGSGKKTGFIIKICKTDTTDISPTCSAKGYSVTITTS